MTVTDSTSYPPSGPPSGPPPPPPLGPSKPEQRAKTAMVQAVIVPTVAALIGAGATLAAPLVAPSSSSPESTVPQSSVISISSAGGITLPNNSSYSRFIECAIYEVQVLAPLARTDPKLAEALVNSHSPIDRKCGLNP